MSNRPANVTPMKYMLAPNFVRSSSLDRHSLRRWSLGTWLHAVMDSLIEARMAHATYCRLVRQGVERGTAIRASFDPPHELCDRAGVPHMKGAAQGEEQRNQ